MPYSAREVLKTFRDCCQGRGDHLVEVAGGWQFRTALDPCAGARDGSAEATVPTARGDGDAGDCRAIPAGDPGRDRTIRGASLSQATIDLLLEVGLIG
jgi:hypothetical protein